VGGVEQSGVTPGRTARLGAGGVVSRPGLFELLQRSARVTALSAPAGSGKTVLLSSWISQAGLGERVAWVSARRDESDPQQFWLSVLGGLRRTAPGSALVRELTAAPDLDGWAIVERLLKDLAPLDDRVWLVVDDVHALGAADTLQQLELLVLRAPPELRFVLASRRDLRLGLHRLRLAALSLAGHPDPERFAAEFSGSERTVADYLLAEILERQPEEVRRLLLRTSVLERVSGSLADAVTGGTGGERVLLELEAANAFVVSVDTSRCTGQPRDGSPTTSIRWRRSGTPRRPGTGGWRAGCWPTTGPACI
jgi:LuxR family maltose regulon positive regulatory protein